MRSFALRVREGSQERSLFAKKELHIGIRRGWSAGSRILFVAKRVPALAASGDPAAVVIGAGTLARVVELADLADDEEKKLCLQNNWYGKLVFSSLARFLPAVPVSQVASLAGAPPALLHGLEIEGDVSAVAAVDALARAKIVT